MSFFSSLFGKKKKEYFVSKVMSSRPRLNQFLADGILRDEWMVIFFFEESLQQISQLVPESHKDHFVLAEKVSGGFAVSRIKSFLKNPEKKIVFGERYPLAENEIKVAERLSVEGIPLPLTIYSSLDDAFFKAFGGDRVKGLMERLGLAEDEFIEHPMIENSIENAQEKLAKKVSVESHTRSASEWFNRNIPNPS